MRAAFLKRRNMVIELLEQIPGMQVNRPEGAFYIFPNISAYFGKKAGNMIINNSDDFAEYILNEGHVAIVAGSAFGADDCFRLSYAASEEKLREAIRRIGECVSKYFLRNRYGC